MLYITGTKALPLVLYTWFCFIENKVIQDYFSSLCAVKWWGVIF